MLIIILTVLITMLVTSFVFIYKMCKCGSYVPFLLAENGIDFEVYINCNVNAKGREVFKKAIRLQGFIAGNAGEYDEYPHE